MVTDACILDVSDVCNCFSIKGMGIHLVCGWYKYILVYHLGGIDVPPRVPRACTL